MEPTRAAPYTVVVEGSLRCEKIVYEYYFAFARRGALAKEDTNENDEPGDRNVHATLRLPVLCGVFREPGVRQGVQADPRRAWAHLYAIHRHRCAVGGRPPDRQRSWRE